jgi:hypothetical protein
MKTKAFLLISGSFLIVLLAGILLSQAQSDRSLAAPSTTINVDSTADAVDTNPGDGICMTARWRFRRF